MRRCCQCTWGGVLSCSTMNLMMGLVASCHCAGSEFVDCLLKHATTVELLDSQKSSEPVVRPVTQVLTALLSPYAVSLRHVQNFACTALSSPPVYTPTRADCVALARRLLENHLLTHVPRKFAFFDGAFWYRFTKSRRESMTVAAYLANVPHAHDAVFIPTPPCLCGGRPTHPKVNHSLHRTTIYIYICECFNSDDRSLPPPSSPLAF